MLNVDPGEYTLEILVENSGRINYVRTLDWLMQKKGLGGDNQLTVTGGDFTTGIDIIGMPFLASWVTRSVTSIIVTTHLTVKNSSYNTSFS